MDLDSYNSSAVFSDKDLRIQNAFLHELSDATVDMLNHSDIDHLLHTITAKLLRLSGGCYCYIAIEHETGDYVEIEHTAAISCGVIHTILKPGMGIGGSAWAENRTIFVNDYQAYNNRIRERLNIHQACAFPLACSDGRGGVVCILFDDPEVDVEGKLGLLQKFAQIVSAALDNARSHQKKLNELSMLEAMMKINQEIYRSTDFLNILDSVCDMIVEGFNANRARVYRYSGGYFEGLSGRIRSNDETEFDVLPSQLVLKESANTWTIENLEAAHVKVGTDDVRETARVHKHRRATDIGCSYIAPLINDTKAWGVLSVHKSIGEPDFNDYEIRLIDLMASQLSVTINRQRLMHEIEYQADHDQLTGCLSRTRFEKLLNQTVEQAAETDSRFALLFIDLDGFKNINDTMGHEVGDNVLVRVAKQIKRLLAEDICMARLGGDEFAVLAPCHLSSAEVSELARAVNESLCVNHTNSAEGIAVTASIGVAWYPDHGEQAQKLLTSADIAMYHAKASGSAQVREFDAEFAASYTRRLKLRTRIDEALANNEFELHYQPKVNAATGTVTSAEALIRWNEPEYANVSPAEWIPLAEETDSIHKIGHFVTCESIRFLKELNDQGLDLKLSMNISATQFDAPDFPQRLLNIMQTTGTPGSAIELEITETAVIKDIGVAVDKLEQLRAKGIKVAIDDFGVEYSSLAYLGDLPVDVLKVDRIFVQQMEYGAGRSMIQPILSLAQSLGLETVVEGVETRSQLDKVIGYGCDFIQGYYFSKPVPGRQLPAVIAKINAGSTEPAERQVA